MCIFFNKYTENFFEIFDNLKKYFLFSSLHYCEKKYIAYITQKVLTSYIIGKPSGKVSGRLLTVKVGSQELYVDFQLHWSQHP